MQGSGSVHAPEERLEAYAVGKLGEEELAALEEHLLICPQCQDRLQEIETFITYFRPVAAELRAKDATRSNNDTVSAKIRRVLGSLAAVPLPLRVAATAVAIAGVILLAPRQSQQPAVYEQVTLQAVRGAGDAGVARASSDRLPELLLDVSTLSPQSTWLIEVVDSSGGKVAEKTAPATGGRVSLRLDERLGKGRYYVRIYSVVERELLREYGLDVR